MPPEYGEGELFLGGDGAAGESSPVMWLVPGEPPEIPLPNYDPERNEDPGLTIQPTALGTWAETDPTIYQARVTWMDAVSRCDQVIQNPFS